MCVTAGFAENPLLEFRLAGPEDSPHVFAWRNDLRTRSMMLTTGPIDPATHAAWFAASLTNASRIMVIATLDADETRERVGSIRFDLSGSDAEVSVVVNPEVRGRGLAASMLSGAEQFLPQDRPIQLVADIKAENIASCRAFTRAGYVMSSKPQTAETEAMVRYTKHRSQKS